MTCCEANSFKYLTFSGKKLLKGSKRKKMTRQSGLEAEEPSWQTPATPYATTRSPLHHRAATTLLHSAQQLMAWSRCELMQPETWWKLYFCILAFYPPKATVYLGFLMRRSSHLKFCTRWGKCQTNIKLYSLYCFICKLGIVWFKHACCAIHWVLT